MRGVLFGVCLAVGLPLAGFALDPPKLTGVQHPAATDAVVGSFFPQDLTDAAVARIEPGDHPLRREFGYAAFDLNGTGTLDFVVAVYTAEDDARVVVLQQSGGNLSRLAVAAGLLRGSDPVVSAKDLDGDGHPEILVGLHDLKRQTGTYPFQWTGTNLVFIGHASELGSDAILFGNFVDLDGDGRLEAINDVSRRGSDMPDVILNEYIIYSLQGGTYSISTPAVLKEDFARGTGPVRVEKREFGVERPRPGTVLRVVNGVDGGARAVRAAIWLNGEEVVSASQFGPQVDAISVPVHIHEKNMLEVRMDDDPQPNGSKMTVLILPPAQGEPVMTSETSRDKITNQAIIQLIFTNDSPWGGGSFTNLVLTGATLGSKRPEGATLPAAVAATLTPGDAAAIMLRYPGDVGDPGTIATFTPVWTVDQQIHTGSPISITLP